MSINLRVTATSQTRIMRQYNLSIIIPVYNASGSLPELVSRLLSVFDNMGKTYEIIFVEDCGEDDSWSVIEQLSKQDERIKGIQLSRNYGQHNALLCGIRKALGEIIITMDDDLQHLPEELPQLLLKLNEGYDVVYGSPKKQQHGFLRGIASRITKWVLQSAMGAETAGKVSALRVFKADLRDAFSHYKSPFVNIDVMLTWGSTRFEAIMVESNKRLYGESGYTIWMLLRHAINMMTGFSTMPLQIASIVGFFFAIFGITVLFFVLGRYLISGSVVPGFAFLASLIAIFSGAQLLALGIIGEYLSRMHFRSMERPPYLIRVDTSKKDES